MGARTVKGSGGPGVLASLRFPPQLADISMQCAQEFQSAAHCIRPLHIMQGAKYRKESCSYPIEPSRHYAAHMDTDDRMAHLDTPDVYMMSAQYRKSIIVPY